MTLNLEAVKQSKYIAMLPESEHPYKLLAHQDRVFAITPGRPPLVLYEDGWREVQFVEADFETEAGKIFQEGIQSAARIKTQEMVKARETKPWQKLPRSKFKKKRR